MRFAIAVLACALAVANAQFGRFNNFGYQGYQGQYNQGRFNQGQYNQGQYNRYQPFNKFNNQGYKPFVNTTPFPPKPVAAKATASVFVAPSSTAVPVVPAVPVAPVVKVVSAPPAAVIAKVVDSNARLAETVRYGNEINPDGSYNYFFETNNGIAAQAQGTPRNFGGNPPVVPDVAQGSFSWISPEGKAITVTYVADENGYQPQSDALPVPPPLPPQIARALEYVARSAKN